MAKHLQLAKNIALGKLFSELPTDLVEPKCTPEEQWELFEKVYRHESIKDDRFVLIDQLSYLSYRTIWELADDIVKAQIEFLEICIDTGVTD